MSSASDSSVGKVVLGRYRIVRPLAQGGMGIVYLARVEGAAGFSKPVVIKQVLSHLENYKETRTQFIREARLLSELQHPGIVGVLDFGEEADAYVMALEYVHGFHLGQWLRYVCKTRGEIPWELAVYSLLPILEALYHAHTRVDPAGRPRVIVHRDISPGNILIDLQGNVRLLDFGIARAVDDPGDVKTRDGVVKGKLSYLAPEIYASVEASPASDIYACGVVLYQLLTGKNPFVGKDMSTTIAKVLQGSPPPVSSMRTDVPESLELVLQQALARAPEGRYENARDFAKALRSCLVTPESELSSEFRTTIESDFTGDMPRLLGVPPLSQLDAAWRESGDNPSLERSLLRSSLPPNTDEASQPIDIPEQSYVGEEATAVTDPLTPGSDVLGEESSSRQFAQTAAQQNIQSSSSNRTLIGAVVGATVVAAAALGLFFTLSNQRAAPPQKQRYLLVERPGGPAALPPASETPAEKQEPAQDAAPTTGKDDVANDDSTSVKLAASPTSESKKSPPAPAATGAQALTRAFSSKAGAVQSCFSSNADSLQGAPQISVRFQVATSGSVNAATLSPGSLSSTSLGQCLLRVARSTQFPAQKAPVAFSIPIRARVVPR